MGRNPFTTDPQWFIDSELLKTEDSIPYLGSMLGDPKGKAHCESRIRATTRSYFALQGAGIKFLGVDAVTSLELYNVAVRPCLYYGCSSVYLSPVQLRNIDKFQNRILKQCLGLNKCALSSVLLKATGINTISDTVNISSLNILKSCILSTSLCNDFYCMLLNDDYLKTTPKYIILQG